MSANVSMLLLGLGRRWGQEVEPPGQTMNNGETQFVGFPIKIRIGGMLGLPCGLPRSRGVGASPQESSSRADAG